MIALALTIYSLNKLLITRYMNGVVYLVGMLLYDIGWVYFTDVMVTVAKELNLPIKLLFPHGDSIISFYMLGIGDIILPGIFAALMYRYDFLRALTSEKLTLARFDTLKLERGFKRPYFIAAILGYFIGLLGTVLAFRFFDSAQPALLFINPAMLLSTLIYAVAKGEMRELLFFDEDRFVLESQEGEERQPLKGE